MRGKRSVFAVAVLFLVAGFLLVFSGGFAAEPPAKLQKKSGPAVTMGDSIGGSQPYGDVLDMMSSAIVAPIMQVHYNGVATGVGVGNPVIYAKLSAKSAFKLMTNIFYQPQQAGGQQVLHIYSFADLKAQGIKISAVAGVGRNWAIGWKYNDFYSGVGMKYKKKPLKGDTGDKWILSPLITNQKIYPKFLNTLDNNGKMALEFSYYAAAYSKADPANALKGKVRLPVSFNEVYVAVDKKLAGNIQPFTRLVGSKTSWDPPVNPE